MVDTLGVFLPSKTILTFVGVLVGQGVFGLGPVVSTAIAGSLTGVSISYHLGRKLGQPALDKYGKRLRLTPERLRQAEAWFARYGPGFIVVAYFTPGLRHLTPYLAGIARLPFWKTILFSALGAFLWVSAFVYLGSLLAGNWSKITGVLDPYVLAGAVFIALVLYLVRVRTAR